MQDIQYIALQNIHGYDNKHCYFKKGEWMEIPMSNYQEAMDNYPLLSEMVKEHLGEDCPSYEINIYMFDGKRVKINLGLVNTIPSPINLNGILEHSLFHISVQDFDEMMTDNHGQKFPDCHMFEVEFVADMLCKYICSPIFNIMFIHKIEETSILHTITEY